MSLGISQNSLPLALRPGHVELPTASTQQDSIRCEKSCLEYLQKSPEKDAREIASALMPYACTDERYKEIRATNVDFDLVVNNRQLLTYRHAACVSRLVSKMLSDTKPQANRYIKRKVSGLDVKITFPETATPSFLLLSRKHPILDICGKEKRGRGALLCAKNDRGEWKVDPLWNLTNKKKSLESFLKARDAEKKIGAEIPSASVPKRYFDFNHVSEEGVIVKRSCYDARYECLIDFINAQKSFDRGTLALAAARSIAAFHQKGFCLGDIKVDNMLTEDGENVFLCDLDSAGPASEADRSKGLVTKSYAGPEWFKRGEIDFLKSDVFSFGCFLYQLSFPTNLPWYDDEAVDKKRRAPGVEANLKKLAEDAKSDLENNKAVSGLHALALLALWAMNPDPTGRPTIQDIITQLEEKNGLQEKFRGLSTVRIASCCKRLVSILAVK